MSRWRIGMDGHVKVVVDADGVVQAIARAAAALAQLQPGITFRADDDVPLVERDDGEGWYEEYEEEEQI